MNQLFPVQERPITPDALQRWDAWLASECYDMLLETLLSEARKVASQAIEDSIKLADQNGSPCSSYLAEALDRRDKSWLEVKWILNAIRILEAIRQGQIKPTRTTITVQTP